MEKRSSSLMLLSAVMVTFMLNLLPTASGASSQPPNVLVILADDVGIGDLGCYGNDTIKTPNIDRLAAEGVKLTHHLSAAPMCTPSRAAMMTSRYAARYGLVAEEKLEVVVIMHTSSNVALPLDEVTLATALRAANYTTALVGKWHLGMYCSLFGLSCPGPLNHGFDTFYGIPVTLFVEFRGPHAFWKFPIHETKFQGLAIAMAVCAVSLIMAAKKYKWRFFSILVFVVLTSIAFFLVWLLMAHLTFNKESLSGVSPFMHRYLNSMLFRQDKVVEKPIQLDGLSQRLAAESRNFLAERGNDKKPFFLYHSFAHVHTPMFTAPGKSGVSKHGRFGDNLEEMDESVGVLLDSLKEFGLEDNTIVYFTSDQGGHLEATDADGQRIGGHNGRFKGGKSQGGPEGGIRVPGIYRWPGHLPKSAIVNTPTSLMDLMPTVLNLAGLPTMKELVPRGTDKELDGINIAQLLKEGDPEEPEERVFIHHCRKAIHAIRLVRGGHVYKMYLFKTNWHKGSTQCGWGASTGCFCYPDTTNITHAPELYDLSVDLYEDSPIDSGSKEYKEIVIYLQNYLENWRLNNYYPPAAISEISEVIWRPLHQPFCLNC